MLTLVLQTSLTMYHVFLIWPMFAYGWVLNIIERGSAAYARVEQLLATPPAVEDKGHVSHVSGADLQFNIETFSYPGTAPVLRDIHLQVKAGQTLGVVGATGSGKSTLLALLLRYYDAPAVRITVGGTPLQD